MKKFISLKLIVFSFILVTSAVSYSNPKIEEGTVADSIKAGLKNAADKEQSLALDILIEPLERKVRLLVMLI